MLMNFQVIRLLHVLMCKCKERITWGEGLVKSPNVFLINQVHYWEMIMCYDKKNWFS